MKFERYLDTGTFGAEVLEILMENEVQNNLPISFIDNKTDVVKDWLLCAVKDDHGSVMLTAACTPPFNVVLYETRNQHCEAAVSLLANELKSIGFSVPGVLAEQSLARRFADIYATGPYHRNLSMNIMRLDRVLNVAVAPGTLRSVREDDLFFAPYWLRAFGEDCHVEVHTIPAAVDMLRQHFGRDTYFIWEDGVPVSQAANGRNTPNGAVVSFVYTPPIYRSRGYASACVTELSQRLLESGRQFCALFADAENPISCGIYRKIGYRDICIYDELRFD